MGKCNHLNYQCKKCNSVGCKDNNCPFNIILDSCNPDNTNFDHGNDQCLVCNAEGSSNFEMLFD